MRITTALICGAALAAIVGTVGAQQAGPAPGESLSQSYRGSQSRNDEYQKVAPIKVFDNLYYVGPGNVAVWLFQTTDGLILIDTAQEPLVDHVIDSIRKVGFDIFDTDWYRTGHQIHRVVFNGIYRLPYDFQVSGLYFYGDNGKQTTTSGVDVFNTGNNQIANRIRADRSIIPRFNFNRKDLHRVDLRFSRSFDFGSRFSFEPMLEAFNLFDRANFTSWQLNESNRLFGTPTQAEGLGYSPRVIQLGFRARF